LSVSDTYDLPDAALLTPSGESARHMVWVPEQLMVVIGKGSDPESELNVQAIRQDEVPVVRRGTGGCAVVLSPEMLVASFVLHTEEQVKSSNYFRHFNGIIIQALIGSGVGGLMHKGISDIALNDRKVGGTALYRNRTLVFYHAILNLSADTSLLEKYLAYPPRTPDYRNGRSHREFVTSFREHGYAVNVSALRLAIAEIFGQSVQPILQLTVA
jgi:lipoate-protein ligase A